MKLCPGIAIPVPGISYLVINWTLTAISAEEEDLLGSSIISHIGSITRGWVSGRVEQSPGIAIPTPGLAIDWDGGEASGKSGNSCSAEKDDVMGLCIVSDAGAGTCGRGGSRVKLCPGIAIPTPGIP